MARTNGGGNNPLNLTPHEEIMRANFLKGMEEKVYCRLCGKEVLNYITADEEYQPGDREKGEHSGCRRAKNAELAAKAEALMAAEQVRIAAIMEARRKTAEAKARKEAEEKAKEEQNG